MNRSVALLLLVLAVGTIRAGLIIDTTDDCANIEIRLPAKFSEMRVDQTDYNFTGTNCVNKMNPKDTLVCSVQEDCEGNFLAKATVCGVQSKYWAGFKVEKLLEDGRYGYVSVYFSQGKKWTQIHRSCIQADRSGATQIKAGGLDHVEITCVRRLNCSQLVTTIMIKNKTICTDYLGQKCNFTDVGNLRTLKARLDAPKERGRTFAFCSTNDAFLSYEIDWNASS